MITDAIERTFYGGYKAYVSVGSFGGINEQAFVGYIAHKSTEAGGAKDGLRMMKIKNSLLPIGLAALVDKILTTNGVWDAGFSNTSTLEAALRKALTPPGEIFFVKSQYSKAVVARIPDEKELKLEGQGHDKNNIGAIRSAHCDNAGWLGQRPKHTLNPAAGASRENLYYMWIELLTSFDKNQIKSLAENGLWCALDEKRRAVERIALVEFTAGRAHEDPPVEKARLVYDYVNNRIYLTVHYDTPNNLEYLKWMSVNPYFLVDHDSQTGTNVVAK